MGRATADRSATPFLRHIEIAGDELHDFPTGAKRMKEPAQGIMATIVNDDVLMEDGEHTGALPGRAAQHLLARQPHLIWPSLAPTGPRQPVGAIVSAPCQ